MLRRGTERWGFEVAEPPHRALVIRAGSLALVRQLLTEITARYPSVKLTVLAPEALAEETAREVNVSVISARGVEPVSYQIRRAVIHKLHAGRFDTVYDQMVQPQKRRCAYATTSVTCISMASATLVSELTRWESAEPIRGGYW